MTPLARLARRRRLAGALALLGIACCRGAPLPASNELIQPGLRAVPVTSDPYSSAEYQAGPPPSPVGTLFAPVPEPNLGEARRSWFSGVFDVVAAVTRR